MNNRNIKYTKMYCITNIYGLLLRCLKDGSSNYCLRWNKFLIAREKREKFLFIDSVVVYLSHFVSLCFVLCIFCVCICIGCRFSWMEIKNLQRCIVSYFIILCTKGNLFVRLCAYNFNEQIDDQPENDIQAYENYSQ